MIQLTTLFDKLWQQYTTDNPITQEIYNLFLSKGEVIINDHIAFRTFSDIRVNVAKFGALFEKLGYRSCGEYDFPNKHLYARHYEHILDTNQPKIFISELKLDECSACIQKMANEYINTMQANNPELLNDNLELLYSGSPIKELDYNVYKQLLSESEYAAWLYVFGFRANHFTIFVNNLKHYNSIESVNQLLKENSYILNNFGGEIKGTPSDLLEQSSTMAQEIMVKFKQGSYKVLNSYYEFARRYADIHGRLYQGFLSKSADKIFESTNILGEAI